MNICLVNNICVISITTKFGSCITLDSLADRINSVLLSGNIFENDTGVPSIHELNLIL